MQEKYLLPSPDVSPETPIPLLTEPAAGKVENQWPSGSTELLNGLTDDNRKLVGYMIPWDPWLYHQLFNPTAGGAEVISFRIADCLLVLEVQPDFFSWIKSCLNFNTNTIHHVVKSTI